LLALFPASDISYYECVIFLDPRYYVVRISKKPFRLVRKPRARASLSQKNKERLASKPGAHNNNGATTMKHYHTSSIAFSGTGSSRSFAFAAVVLLHIGLIVTIAAGLGPREIFAPPHSSKTWVIEPPPVTPLQPVAWKPVPTAPPKPIDINGPVLPPIDGGHPITEVPSQPLMAARQPIAQPVITLPTPDARHPLSQPAYPASARRTGAEGTVELALLVLENGRIGEAKVAHSSGFSELDEAAVKEALRAWHLIPQRVDGVAVSAWHNIAVTFRLKN
jgi:protein TonB